MIDSYLGLAQARFVEYCFESISVQDTTKIMSVLKKINALFAKSNVSTTITGGGRH